MSTKTSQIDWQQVHQRIATSRAAVEKSSARDEDVLRRALKHRAAALAQRPSAERRTNKGARMIVFLRGQERFELELSYVTQVCRLPACTPLPGAMAGVVGIANFDGEVRSVVDILPVIGVAAPAEEAPAFGLLAKLDHIELAIVADRIEHVSFLHPEDLHTPDAAAEHAAISVSCGIGPHNSTVLDVKKLFAAFNAIVGT